MNREVGPHNNVQTLHEDLIPFEEPDNEPLNKSKLTRFDCDDDAIVLGMEDKIYIWNKYHPALLE